MTIHQDFPAFLEAMQQRLIYAVSTKGKRYYTDVTPQDYLGKEAVYLLGAETRGLPDEFLKQTAADQIITLPMQANSRSLNLSNSAAIIAYHAWSIIDFQPLSD